MLQILLKSLRKILQISRRLILLISVLRIKSYRSLLFHKLDKNLPVIDLGANKGQTAIIFWVKGIETYCLEPHPNIFKKLYKTFKDVKKIHTLNYAVISEFEEEKKFKELYLHESSFLEKKDFSQASSLMSNKSNVNKNNIVKVKTIKYANILKKSSNFGLLKCDIEGYEYILYRDIIKYHNSLNYIMIETHAKKNPQWIDAHKSLIEEFKNLPLSKYNLNWH